MKGGTALCRATHQLPLFRSASKRHFSSSGCIDANSFQRKYCVEEGDNPLELYLSNVFRIPGAASDAVGAFEYQVNHSLHSQQWVGRAQLGQVVAWSEVLRAAAAEGLGEVAFMGMRAALQRSTALPEDTRVEAMEGLLRALMLSTPGTLGAVQEVSKLVRGVLDDGLGEGIAASCMAQGHPAQQAHTLASWRGSDLLSLPEWVLQGEAEGAVDRANLYWLPPTWPNPALPAAAGVWHSSLLSPPTPWWAASTYTATTARIVRHLQDSGEEEALAAALTAACTQYSADAAVAMGQGWGASGSPEYLSTLVEVAAGWMAFASDYDSAWLVQEEGPPNGHDPPSHDYGVTLPTSIQETEGVASQWAGSRTALSALLRSVPASSAAWEGLVKHGETVMAAGWEAVQSSPDREEGRDYFAQLAAGGSEGPIPPAVAAALPDYMRRVLEFHAAYLPVLAQLRHQACSTAQDTLDSGTVQHPIMLSLLQDTAKTPARMGDVTSTVSGGRGGRLPVNR